MSAKFIVLVPFPSSAGAGASPDSGFKGFSGVASVGSVCISIVKWSISTAVYLWSFISGYIFVGSQQEHLQG